MSDFDDYMAGLSTGTPGMDFSDIDAKLAEMEALQREFASERVPVRVDLTATDMAALLSRWGVQPGPSEVGMWPLASLRGLPVCYGERSEIVYSDGTTEPLRKG